VSIGRHVDADRAPVTVISGATGGVGRALAETRRNDRLVLLGRDPDKLAELARDHPEATTHQLDFSSPDAIAEPFAGLDRVDRLVHCTGVVSNGYIAELDPASTSEIMAASFLSPLMVTQAALPLLRLVGGLVVFVSSGSAKRVRPGWTAYAAAKHAARALAEGIRVEEPNVRVLTVYCGAIDTPMRASIGETRNVDYQPEDYLDPVEVARAVSFAFDTRPGVSIGEIDMRMHGT
jgi:NAD(P)-dependent dehydrogenase (short-subunit alcohol dehydrogenase family)